MTMPIQNLGLETGSWPRVLIKDVCESITDCVNKTALTVDFETPYKMIRTTNVKRGRIDIFDVRYVEEDVYRKWTRRGAPRVGDVILTREAPLGEVGMLKTTDHIFLGQRLMQYRAEPTKLDNRYLLYAFQGEDLQGQIKALGSGATVEHMRVPDAENLTLPLPPLDIQRKIGDILGAYDDLFEVNLSRVDVLERMVRTVYKEWFVRFRTSDQNEENQIPSGWMQKKIGEVLNYQIGGGWGQEEASDAYPVSAYVIRGADIPGARHVQVATCPYRYHKFSNFASRKLEAGDIVFEVSGGSKGQPVGRSLLVSDTVIRELENKAICASFCKLLRVNQDILAPEILYLQLMDIYEDGRIEKYQTQSTGIINLKFSYFLEDATVLVPPINLQADFLEIVRPMLALIQNLGLRNSRLRSTKDALLPKLLANALPYGGFDVDTEEG